MRTITRALSSRLARVVVEAVEPRRLLATFTVDTNSDATNHTGTSLRDAIALANSTAGADTIVFSPAAFPDGPATLTSRIALRSFSGPLTLSDAAGVTIQGLPDPQRVQISGLGSNGAIRPFIVDAGTATFRNLTIANGLGNSSPGMTTQGGGAVVVDPGSTLIAEDCRFVNNIANTSGAGTQSYGGAVLGGTNSTLTFSRCYFAENDVPINQFGFGSVIGGLQNITISLTDCRFENNGRVENEGLIYLSASSRPVTITRTMFINNIGNVIQAQLTTGGTAALTIRDSTFTGGTEATGTARAAIVISSIGGSTLPVSMTNVTISGNAYPAFLPFGVTATLTHCTITDNHSSTSAAGGIVTQLAAIGPAITLRNSIVAGNTRTSTIGTGQILPGDMLDGGGNNTGATGTNNVIGAPFASGGLVDGVNGNRVGKPGTAPDNALTTADLLYPLNDNGGSVWTHAVLTTGKAYNAGSAANATGIASDARGQLFNRVANGLPDAGAYEVQTITPPRVSESLFDVDGVNSPGYPHRLEIRWETPINPTTLANFDLELTNLTTGQVVPAASIVAAYDSIASRATFAFPGFTHAILPDGNYRATLAAGAVADFAGTLSVAYTIDFTVLTGDANRSKTVDFDDLLTLAQNYGQSGKYFSQGNFNYSPDGKVDFDDLLLLAQRYGTSLSTPAPVVSTAKCRTGTIDVVH